MDGYVILIITILVIAIAGSVFWFIKLPSGTKIANLKEWLKWGVTEAERTLGSGTGQLKLRLVYDMAVQKFPWLMTVVTFTTFSSWVDEALDWMKAQLAENKSAQEYVNATSATEESKTE